MRSSDGARRLAFCRVLAAMLCGATSAAFAQTAPSTVPVGRSGRIIVGPEIPVTADGDVPHVELMLAAHPRDARQLIGAAITGTSRVGGMANKVYTTFDGGLTWTDVDVPGQRGFGSGDPQIAFGTSGTAYFTALTTKFDEVSKRTRSGLWVYRSEDGGLTWEKPIDLGFGYDHEQIVVDHSVGRFAGRVYLGALYGYPVYHVGIFRSTDDGRSFIGPVEVANGKGEYGINVVNLLVLSDGTLFVPFDDFEFKPDRRKGNPDANLWFATSSDGGITFAAAKKIFQQKRTTDSLSLTTFPSYAVDNRSLAFRDRLYVVWSDFRTGRGRLLFSTSSDRGEHWADARMLDAGAPADADQYQPEVVVNADGVVAITWFDTRGSRGGRSYHEYFTASVDGGASFLPPRVLSSAPSIPIGPGNLAAYPRESRGANDTLRMSFLSAADRWGHGGDYMGLAVDAAGAFHPWWADSRSGTFQVYTTVVRVEGAAASSAIPASRPSGNGSLTRESVNSAVHLVFGIATYDSAAKTYAIPVRLRNEGARAIHAPIVVEVSGLGGSGRGTGRGPELLNSSNGKTGDGATFDYSAALGDVQVLEPGGQSGVVVWRLRTSDPLHLPGLTLSITGMVGK